MQMHALTAELPANLTLAEISSEMRVIEDTLSALSTPNARNALDKAFRARLKELMTLATTVKLAEANRADEAKVEAKLVTAPAPQPTLHDVDHPEVDYATIEGIPCKIVKSPKDEARLLVYTRKTNKFVGGSKNGRRKAIASAGFGIRELKAKLASGSQAQ